MTSGGSMPKTPAKSGDEQDVTSQWRKVYCYTQRPGVCAKVKRAMRRRERHDRSYKRAEG